MIYSKMTTMLRFSMLALCLSSSLIAVSAEERTFFTSSRLLLGIEAGRSACVRIGDIDGDRDLEVVVANGRHWPQQNFIFFNQGHARFNLARPLGRDLATSYAAELADLDNDGDIDIAVGNDTAPNAVFFNRGAGTSFFEVRFGEPSQVTYNLAVGDLNQDGYTDIAVANSDSQNQVYLNRSGP
jgi:hypothetical protein